MHKIKKIKNIETSCISVRSRVLLQYGLIVVKRYRHGVLRGEWGNYTDRGLDLLRRAIRGG